MIKINDDRLEDLACVEAFPDFRTSSSFEYCRVKYVQMTVYHSVVDRYRSEGISVTSTIVPVAWN